MTPFDAYASDFQLRIERSRTAAIEGRPYRRAAIEGWDVQAYTTPRATTYFEAGSRLCFGSHMHALGPISLHVSGPRSPPPPGPWLSQAQPFAGNVDPFPHAPSVPTLFDLCSFGNFPVLAIIAYIVRPFGTLQITRHDWVLCTRAHIY